MSTSWRPNAAGSSSLGPVTHPTRAVTFQSIHYVAPETGEIWSRFGEANLRWIHGLDLLQLPRLVPTTMWFTVWGKKRGLFRSLHGRCSSHPLYKGFVKYLFIWKVQGIGNSLFADGYSYRLHPPKMRRMPTSQRPLSCMVHLCQVLFSAEIWQHMRCVNPYVIFTNILHTNQSLPDFFHDNLRPALTTCALVRPVVKHNAAPVATWALGSDNVEAENLCSIFQAW